VGALVTLDLPDDSPALELPWIITFGPLTDDEDWEPVVCGPYEQPHAIALAEDVVADEQLMAVVEPVMSFVMPEEIRAEIAVARAAAAADAQAVDQADNDEEAEAVPVYPADSRVDADDDSRRPAPLPDPSEVRAGMARVLARLARSADQA
jgi:hypothetical protein